LEFAFFHLFGILIDKLAIKISELLVAFLQFAICNTILIHDDFEPNLIFFYYIRVYNCSNLRKTVREAHSVAPLSSLSE
jgi:hypothetical protein